MKKKSLALGLVAAAMVFVGAGCTYEKGTAEIEQELTEKNQETLLANQPPPTLDWSLERDNIIRRTELWNDQNKVSYIYLTDFGRVMAFYTIRGKVSSVDSSITNPEQLAYARISTGAETSYVGVDGTLPSPSEDGSYGTNGDAVYFFTTDGVYVEWSGDYLLVDEPLAFTSQPELVREIK